MLHVNNRHYDFNETFCYANYRVSVTIGWWHMITEHIFYINT